MQHLFQSSHDPYRTEAFFATSAAFQVLAASRDHVPVTTCLRVVQDGWVQDPDERGPEDRPLLLAFLGTLRAHAWNVPERPVAWFDERDAWWRASTVPPAETLSMGRMNPELGPVDPMGPPVPGLAMRVALTLLDQGANPWLRDVDGRDSMDQAFSLGWSLVWQRLLDRDDAPARNDLAQRTLLVPFLNLDGLPRGVHHRGTYLPWLHATTVLGRDGMLERMFERGFDVNQRDALGRSPLFYAQLPSTVTLLLDRGADPMLQDQAGDMAGVVWSKLVEQSTNLGAMNQLLHAHLKPRFESDPDALRRMHRPALYDLALSGTKDNVLKFMRSNGFTASDRLDDGRSLLSFALMGALKDWTRHPALGQHLLERVSDPWHESFPGVPDAMLAWLAGHGSEVATARAFRERANQTLMARYDWTQAKGYALFANGLMQAAQALVNVRPQLASRVGNALAHGLYRSMRGETIPETRTEKSRQVPFAPDGWAKRRQADGTSCGWSWGAMAVHLALPSNVTDSTGSTLSAALQALMEDPQNGRYSFNRPVVPYDEAAMHAFMVPMGDHVSFGRPKGFRADNVFHRAFQMGVEQGLTLNPSRPGFEPALQRIRENNPPIAQAVEDAALRQTLEAVLKDAPVVERSPRRRM